MLFRLAIILVHVGLQKLKILLKKIFSKSHADGPWQGPFSVAASASKFWEGGGQEKIWGGKKVTKCVWSAQKNLMFLPFLSWNIVKFGLILTYLLFFFFFKGENWGGGGQENIFGQCPCALWNCHWAFKESLDHFKAWDYTSEYTFSAESKYYGNENLT